MIKLHNILLTILIYLNNLVIFVRYQKTDSRKCTLSIFYIMFNSRLNMIGYPIYERISYI